VASAGSHRLVTASEGLAQVRAAAMEAGSPQPSAATLGDMRNLRTLGKAVQDLVQPEVRSLNMHPAPDIGLTKPPPTSGPQAPKAGSEQG